MLLVKVILWHIRHARPARLILGSFSRALGPHVLAAALTLEGASRSARDAPTAAVSGSDPLVERNPLRYRGYYFDTATGMYYLPARYYDPESARFLSVDPAPPEAGDPVSINKYVYCVVIQ